VYISSRLWLASVVWFSYTRCYVNRDNI